MLNGLKSYQNRNPLNLGVYTPTKTPYIGSERTFDGTSTLTEQLLTLWLARRAGCPMNAACFLVCGAIDPDFQEIIQTITAPDPNGPTIAEGSLSPLTRLNRWLKKQEGCIYELRRGDKDWRKVSVERSSDVFYLKDLGEAA